MDQQHEPLRVLHLVGEGGGLSLFRFQQDGVIGYTWDCAWQVPDENGDVPMKTVGWEPKTYACVSEAIDAAPRYWIFLLPVFVREDLRNLLLTLVSARLGHSNLSSQDIEDKLNRWKTAGLPRARGGL